MVTWYASCIILKIFLNGEADTFSVACPGPYNMIEGVGGFGTGFKNEEEQFNS